MSTTGSCIIDNYDISQMGMFIVRGGDNDLISFPERKAPPKNDWFEEDGEDVDLSEVWFNAKKTTIKFYLNAVSAAQFMSRLAQFEEMMLASGYRYIYVREFDKTFTLRYTGCSSFAQRGGLFKPGTKSAELDVDFMMDDPLLVYDLTKMTPSSDKVADTYVKLNGIELKTFGITVQKIYDSTLKLPDVKEGLIISNERMTGQMADVQFTPKRQARKISIECTMMAPDKAAFFNNYNALFNQLTQPGSATITINGNVDFDCYYNNMASFNKTRPFSIQPKISFTLNLTQVYL